MNTEEVIRLIHDSPKRTIARAFVSGDLSGIEWGSVHFIGSATFGTAKGDLPDILKVLETFGDRIDDCQVEVPARNSAIPLADLTKYEARIEPGAIIRDMVEIGKNAVIMMGAVINIGASIGEGTMIDMNAVLGGRATVGKNCHIGAGAVLAGVVEPASAQPVVVEDGVLVGANAVVIEGVRIGAGSVVAAGAVVIEDVPAGVVVAGTPARVIKTVDAKTEGKTALVAALRSL